MWFFLLGLALAQDQDRIQAHLEALTGASPIDGQHIASRHIAHPDILLAEGYVQTHFEDLGLEVWLEDVDLPSGFVSHNVVAEIPGRSDLPWVVLGAHYDSTAALDDDYEPSTDPAPGADDNASGMAALLEVAAALSAEQFEHPVRFVAFTGEERGLLGSFRHVEALQARGEAVRVAVIMDPIGYNSGGVDRLFASYQADWKADAEAWAALPSPLTLLSIDEVVLGGDERSDHHPFQEAGFSAQHVGVYPLSPDYHTGGDTLDDVDPRFVTEAARVSAAMIRQTAIPAAIVETPGACDTGGAPLSGWLLVTVLTLLACQRTNDTGDDTGGDTDRTEDTGSDTADTDDSDTEPCAPAGTQDCPIEVATLPFTDSRDTTSAPSDAFDSYACAPSTNEAGPEFVYRVAVPGPGVLTAHVADGAGVDIDTHLLDSSGACLARHDTTWGWRVDAGIYTVVADTWVSAGGEQQAGAYDLTLRFYGSTGPCAMVVEDQEMFWSSCAPGVDCFEDSGDTFLRLPAVGEVVGEAHLVTPDDGFGSAWPTSFTDGIDTHYALSQAATGYVMSRDQPWAPAGEGGSEFGQGSTGAKVPVLDEAWYVNMYWRTRPAKGTRLFVIDPATGQGVVTSGGYETGPGANTAIGGAVEEVHDVLGSSHRDVLLMGFAVDQGLDLGPIDCR